MKAIHDLRLAGKLRAENYWLYVGKTKKDAFALDEEHKTPGYIGFFVEDDTRLPKIAEIATKKIKKYRNA